MTIIEENDIKWPQFSQLKKCGSLTISEDMESLGLNCFYCFTIFTQLDEFGNHVKTAHSCKVAELYTNSTAKPIEDIKSNFDEGLPSFNDLLKVTVEEVTIKLEPNLYLKEDKQETERNYDPFGDDNWNELDDTFDAEQEDDEEEEFLECNNKSLRENYEIEDTVDTKSKKKNPVKNKPVKTSTKKKKKSRANKERNVKKVLRKRRSLQQISDEDNFSNDDSDHEPLQQKEAAESDSEDDEGGEQDAIDNEDLSMACPKIDVLSPVNHTLINHIIDFYQKIPFLWDYRFKDAAKKNEKIDTLNGLCLQLEIKFHIKLTPKECRRIFRNLRRHYYSDMELYGKKTPTSSKKKLWCYDKLNFLGPKDERNRKFSASVPTEHITAVANVYQNYPILWDFENEDRHNKTLSDKALEDMRMQLQPQLAKSEVQLAITRIRGLYKAEKVKRIQCLDKQITFQPDNVELYEKLNFLENNIGPYRCTYDNCSVYSRSNEAHKTHLASHEGRHAFSCKFCPKTYKTLCGVEGHILRHHTSETPFQCPYCDKSFHTAGDRRAHQNAHKEAGLNYVCDLCGKGYHTRSYLNRHQKTHAYQYQCPHCPKKYGARYRLQDHLNSHAQVRAHICKECGKGFFSSKTLYQHKQLHKDENNYQCNLCGKQFKQSSAMHSHLKNHHKADDIV